MVTSWLPRCPVRGCSTPLPAMRSTSPLSVSGGTTSSALPSIVGTLTVLQAHSHSHTTTQHSS